MSLLDFLNKTKCYKELPAMILNEQVYSYTWLEQQEVIYLNRLQKAGVNSGSVVYFIADYSTHALAILIALMRLSAIIVPITHKQYVSGNDYFKIIKPDFNIELDSAGNLKLSQLNVSEDRHKLILELKNRKTAGLIIFSSGSSGTPKAIVHELSCLTKGLKPSKNHLKVISFLQFAHMGGINTILNTLISGNCLVIPSNRTPKAVSDSIHKNKVDVLVTSPSFLNLMLIGNAFNEAELSSLKQINYGSEVMPSALLDVLIKTLPSTKFIQTYGLSELGVIRTKTSNLSPNLFDIKDEHVKYRIVDGKLEIYSENSMLGYLNAPTPFTEDGWFITGDAVEIIDGSLKILGRDSELINIGGEKVFPAEIENIILQLPEVEDVSVFGERNLILGNIIVAKIKLKSNINHLDFKQRARQFCLKKIPAFKVPQKIKIVSSIAYGERFKKIRN